MRPSFLWPVRQPAIAVLLQVLGIQVLGNRAVIRPHTNVVRQHESAVLIYFVGETPQSALV